MNTKRLVKLIRIRTNVLWILKLRESGTLERLRMMQSKCPSYVLRTRLTYLLYSTTNLENKLWFLSQDIDRMLEEINIHDLTDVLL